MELTPEERQRIYEEEKARIEARNRINEEDLFQTKVIREEQKRKSLTTLQIILSVIIAFPLLFILISSTLKTLFVSQETKDEVAKEIARVNEENKRIDDINYQIDREKDILWKSGQKGESRKMKYLSPEAASYHSIYYYFDLISFILAAAIIIAFGLFRNQNILQFVRKKEPLKFKTKEEYEQWKRQQMEKYEDNKE
jgi:hypothetical protein